jgi:hopanoid biosynthesis associated membrane protein HpnM
MKGSKALSTHQNYQKLEPVFDMSFDFPLMVQIAVGSYWKATDQELRLKVIKSFRRLSISTVATLFDGYSGEFFEYKKNSPGPYKTILVVTDLVKSDKTRIEISYVTRKFRNGWRIIDVILGGGISEIKVRQSEYRQILKMAGISGLIGLLDKKSNELIMTSTTR